MYTPFIMNTKNCYTKQKKSKKKIIYIVNENAYFNLKIYNLIV